jgi:V/A-type H+-transporting ATPase subunit A
VASWWNTNVDPKWKEMRDLMVRTLIREDELRQIVRLVGPESLAEKDKLVLETARLVREAFLKQNAYDDIDAFSSPQKQARIMRLISIFNTRASRLVEKGLPVKKIMDRLGDIIPEIIRSKATIKNDELQKYDELERKLNSAFDSLEKEVSSQ